MKKPGRFSLQNREKNLEKVKRYGKFSVMFYRTNLLIHSRRVQFLLEGILPFALDFYPDLDAKKAKLIANYHDDLELVLEGGDIPLQLKLMMDDSESLELKQKEILAAETIASFYPKKIKGYNCEQLLLHAILKDCEEAQLVSLVDKYDGYCEAIHEVLAGNTIFLEPIINYNLKTFNNLKEKYPLVNKIFDLKNVWFEFHVVDLKVFFEDGNIGSFSHTKETIKNKTYILQYEKWKKLTTDKFGFYPLINQVEFHRAHETAKKFIS